jgi:TldD protein
MTHTRREFLKQVSAATAFGVLHRLPGRALWAMAPGALIPEPDEALLKRLALTAVDAARTAGAAFADVRVTGMRRFNWGAGFNGAGERPGMSPPRLEFSTAYGVRAAVDGAWGFAGGYVLTPEAIAQVARRAVSRAKGNRPRRPRTLELAPVARVENGLWAPPIAQDPFAVPVGEQADLALAALAAAAGVRGVLSGIFGAGWQQSLTVFASSEGSLTVQRLTRGGPGARVWGRSRDDNGLGDEDVASLRQGWYGYEALSRVDDLAGELRQAAERAVAKSGPPDPPPVPVEVGRYDLVLSGWAVAHVLRATLVPALDLERALGYQANRAGTSFAAPPTDILGKYQVASPLVTLRADRTRPHDFATVGWDDEGVPAGEWTLIKDGVIVDYLTSRHTAVELAPLYRARGEPLRSRGCMVGSGATWPEISTPNLTLEPGPAGVSLDDLIGDVKRGFYIDGGAPGGSDQQLLSGQFIGGGVREIRNGKLGREVNGFAFQILTQPFWKNLDALGGPETVKEGGVTFSAPLRPLRGHTARASAARVRQVNVLNTERKL